MSEKYKNSKIPTTFRLQRSASTNGATACLPEAGTYLFHAAVTFLRR